MHEMDTTHDDDYLLSLSGMAPVPMLHCCAFMNYCSKDSLLVGQACQPSRKLCLQLRGIKDQDARNPIHPRLAGCPRP